MLCAMTRVELVTNPSDHRQWNATGSVVTNAVVPLHRCNPATHRGGRPARGNRRHIQSAVTSWTASRAVATVDSHAFIGSMLEKPRSNSGRCAGEWALP